MRLILPRLLLAMLIGAASSVAAQTDPQTDPPVTEADQTIYNTLYREKLTSVNRTRSTEDDLTLAQEMLAFAKQIPDDTGVQRLIYIDVIALSAAGMDLAMMQEAAGQLQTLWPEHESVSPDYLLELAGRAYRSVPRSSRTEVGEQYVSLLIKIAQQAEDKRELDQALNVCRQASTIARSLESDQRQAVDSMLERLAAESAVASRIDMLTLSVRKNPQNTPAARELVDLLITKRNDPAAAAEFAASTKDEELIDLIALSTQGIEQATAPTAMRLGDWYLALAEDEPDRYALPLLQDALACYQRFFSLYPREDALAKRTQAMQQAVEARLTRLGHVADPEPQDPNNTWLDVLANVYDHSKHRVFNPSGLTFENGKIYIDDSTKFVLPLAIKDAYELRMQVSVEEISNSYVCFTIYLPIGETGANVRYHARDTHWLTIDGIDEEFPVKDSTGNLLQKSEILYQAVALETGQLAMVIFVNGQRIVRWLGKPEALEQHPTALPPEEFGKAFTINCASHATFYKIEYREPKTDPR